MICAQTGLLPNCCPGISLNVIDDMGAYAGKARQYQRQAVMLGIPGHDNKHLMQDADQL